MCLRLHRLLTRLWPFPGAPGRAASSKGEEWSEPVAPRGGGNYASKLIGDLRTFEQTSGGEKRAGRERPSEKMADGELERRRQVPTEDREGQRQVEGEEEGERQQASPAEGAAQSDFRLRTSQRRHLDFDGPYELAEPQAANRSRWSGPFHFIQAADSQFGMIDSYVHKRTEPGWAEEIELCERLVRACNDMTPSPLFLVICGDLVDSWPGSELGRKQVADFKRIFAKLSPRVPLVCVCGNHDVGDEPTEQTVGEYRRTFGDDYFYFTKNDVLFIVINSQFYQHRDNVRQLAEEQDRWLLDVLAKCRLFKYSIVFEHIPWFLAQPDEEDDYFNIRKAVRLAWLRRFKEAGVSKIMCGHYHRNAGGWFEGLELVVTSAIGAQCGLDQSGVRLVKLLEDRIEHQYYAMADIPRRVEF